MDAATEIRTRAREAADEAQRAAIAEATCRVIATEGLEAASLRRIGTELGCTTGLVTHYFASKEHLLIAVLRWAARRIGEVAAAGREARPASLDDHLEYFYDSLPVDEERRHYWLVLLAFRGATIGNAVLAEVYREYSDDMERAMRGAVAATASLDEDDLEVVRVTKGLAALLEGVGISAAEDPSIYTERFVRSIVAPAAAGLLGSLRSFDRDETER